MLKGSIQLGILLYELGDRGGERRDSLGVTVTVEQHVAHALLVDAKQLLQVGVRRFRLIGRRGCSPVRVGSLLGTHEVHIECLLVLGDAAGHDAFVLLIGVHLVQAHVVEQLVSPDGRGLVFRLCHHPQDFLGDQRTDLPVVLNVDPAHHTRGARYHGFEVSRPCPVLY